MNGSSKDEGIIINKREYGEADRIVTIFTKEHGKLVSIIKGIRKGVFKCIKRCYNREKI